MTGRKCEKLFIDLIVPKWDDNDRLVSFENHVVNVNYLKTDIEILLATFKDEILDDLNNTINTTAEAVNETITNVDEEYF